jgi:uncharacterized protein involved in response to NO
MTVFSLGFRPFFIGAGLFGLLGIALWMAVFTFNLPLPVEHVSMVEWHAHEMIYGYSLAVIAGFLLTAVRNWTGIQTLHGTGLLILLGLWLAARIAFSVTGHIAIAGLLDTAFMLVLLVSVSIPCIQARQWQQIAILSKLLLLTAGNVLFYLGATGELAQGIHWGIYGGLYLIIGLILTMARRVVPFFIERGVGYPVQLFNAKWLDITSVVLFLGFFVSEVFLDTARVSAWCAAGLFIVHTIRLIGWHTPGIWKAPLLWSLYVSLIFINLGFLLFVFSVYGDVPVSLALHAFAVGGIGLMTLGMMSRVALGHTGRNVQSPPRLVGIALAFLTAATVARVLLPLVDLAHYSQWIGLSQLLWLVAFALFMLIYIPILIAPRVDGQPG